jgi:hypothetical protein
MAQDKPGKSVACFYNQYILSGKRTFLNISMALIRKGVSSMGNSEMEEKPLALPQEAAHSEIKPKRCAEWKLKLIDRLKERNRKIRELTVQLSCTSASM